MKEPFEETRERQARKKMIREIEAFTDFGGFIGELANSLIYQAFPDEISSVVNYYIKSGKGYSYVAGEVEKAFRYTDYEKNYLTKIRETARMKNISPDQEDVNLGTLLYRFHRWYVIETAHICTENLKTDYKHFWTGHRLSIGLLNTLMKLSPLEERVLGLKIGAFTGTPLDDADKIAEAFCAMNNSGKYVELLLENMREANVYPSIDEWKELREHFTKSTSKEGR